MRKRCFIFLDVDGPINTDVNINRERQKGRSTSSYRIKLPNKQLYNLSRIVQEVNGDIVLSSKWRLIDAYSKLYMTYSPARLNLESQLNRFGMTIYSQTPFMDHNRGLEINTWLNKFQRKAGYKPAYIILDDKLDPIINEHRGHIVYCSPSRGILDKEVEIAINLFKRQNAIIFDPVISG